MLVIPGKPQGGADQAGDISGWHLETYLSRLRRSPKSSKDHQISEQRVNGHQGERASVSRSNRLVSDLDGGFSRGHRLDPFSQWIR